MQPIKWYNLPTTEELISYFGFAGDARTRARTILNK